MTNQIILNPNTLTKKSFAPYGQVCLGPNAKPNYSGEGWKSLFPAAKAHLPQAELGWVVSKKPENELIISGMEREPEIEMIWPVTEPLIHVVALPGDLKNHAEQPNIKTVKAFIILPGQVILMHPGTWHYASFPLTSDEVFYYFLTKDHPRDPGGENTAWVPFFGNETIKIELNKSRE